MPADQPQSWPPPPQALWADTSGGPGQPQTVTLLRHASHPFSGQLPLAAAIDAPRWLPTGADLLPLVRAYVDAIAAAAGLPEAVSAALGQRAAPGPGGLGWLPLGWGGQWPATLPPDPAAAGWPDPRASFWVLRRDADGCILDRSAVMLAARQQPGGQAPGTGIGGDVGLRVVVHVGPPARVGEGWQAPLRITGASLSRLGDATAFDPVPGVLAGPAAALAPLAQALGLPGGVVLQSLGTGANAGQVLVQGEGWRPGLVTPADGAPGRRYSFTALVGADGRLLQRLSWAERQASAAPRRAGAPTPASWLAAWAHDHTPSAPRADTAGLATAANTTAGPATAGADPTPPAAPPAAPPATPPATPPAEWVCAWRDTRPPAGTPPVPHGLDADNERLALDRANQLFARLDQYGLGVEAIFKLARLPLQVRSRAPIAGDEEAVNAEVRPIDCALSATEAWWRAGPGGAQDQRPRLLVRFGAADVAQRWEQRDAAGRLADVQPLSIAADMAWAWHEFAHVLIFASTGALEFRFAHSAGDALAAIAQDPDSGDAIDSEPRGRTFRLVPLARRHDRDARLGWCWCGRRSQVRLAGNGHGGSSHHGGPLRRLGYFEEELMSSSLFRLYRSLGGDTPGSTGWAARHSASEYTLYLVMRAIALLGPDHLVPARSADHFVSALIDADLGTGAWEVLVAGPAEAPTDTTLARQGGLVHKVVRWAFEAQGLYAADAPSAVAEGPGLPPPVDLFIADRRPAADGGYQPVALLADAADAPWWAAPDALRWQDGGVVVQIRNRGQQTATRPTVRAWAQAASDGAAQQAGPWQALDAPAAPPAAVPSGAVVTLHVGAPAGWQAGAAWWVLVAVDDPADPSNLPAGTTPPAPLSAGLMALVAHDNNLALGRLLRPAGPAAR